MQVHFKNLTQVTSNFVTSEIKQSKVKFYSPEIYSQAMQHVTALHQAHANPSLLEIPPKNST